MGIFRLSVLCLVMCLAFELKAQGAINVAISASPNNLSPFYSTDANSQNINRMVHASLIDFNENMQFVCIACETFKEEMRGAKQVFTFKLKSDLTFTDGQKVTSEDVKKSYEYFAKDENIKSTFMGAYEAIESLNIIDASTFELVYKSFSLENLSNLSLLKIVKLKNPKAKTYDAQDIIGCGSYSLDSVTPLEIKISPRNSKKSPFSFKVVKDETTLALKLINKEIDVSVANMSPRKVYWLKTQKNIKIWERPSANFQFIGLNHRREMFQDIRVRKAISLLIPRDNILKYKLKNTAVLSVGMFSPAFSDIYVPTEVDKNDVVEARKLLNAAGWKKNAEGIMEKEGKPLEIDWKVSNNKASIEIVEVMEHFFKEEGIVVKITVQEWATYMSAFKNGNFDIVVGQWIGFTGPDMLKFVFHSENIPPKGANRTAYNNPKLDLLLDQATLETNAEMRNKLFKEAIKMINEDYAYVNLWHPNIIWIARDCISDVNLESTGSFYPLTKIEKHCGK